MHNHIWSSQEFYEEGTIINPHNTDEETEALRDACVQGQIIK